MIVLAQATRPSVDQVVSPLIGTFFLAFAVAFLATPLMRWLARRNQIVDWPDMKRKTHAQPIPYLGGVAIFLGFIAGMALAMTRADVQSPVGLLLGATVIAVVGMIDDIYGISPRVKLGGQLLAAAALASEKLGGTQTLGFALVDQTFQVLGAPNPPYVLTYTLGAVIIAFFVMGGCNSLNFIDGLDGLAAGVTAIAHAGFLFIAVYLAVSVSDPELRGSDPSAFSARIVLSLAVLGAVLGFLPYNFNPASIFMGDAGSNLLGFLSVSAVLLFGLSASKGPLFVTAALIVFAVPIMDASLAIVRRRMRGLPVSAPDNQHLHHQCLRFWQAFGLQRNSAVKIAVFCMYLLAAVFAVLGCLMVFLRWRYVVAVAAVLFGFILIAAYKRGHRQATNAPLEPNGASPGAAADPRTPAAQDEAAGAATAHDRARSDGA